MKVYRRDQINIDQKIFLHEKYWYLNMKNLRGHFFKPPPEALIPETFHLEYGFASEKSVLMVICAQCSISENFWTMDIYYLFFRSLLSRAYSTVSKRLCKWSFSRILWI